MNSVKIKNGQKNTAMKGLIRLKPSSCSVIFYPAPYLYDNLWHHECVTWDNSDGKVKWYTDGVLKYTQTGRRVGQTIPTGGTLLIGQIQTSNGNDPSAGLVGDISHVNIWSSVLLPEVVAALSKEAGTESGDALSWRGLRTNKLGNVQVIDQPGSSNKAGKCALLNRDSQRVPLNQILIRF